MKKICFSGSECLCVMNTNETYLRRRQTSKLGFEHQPDLKRGRSPLGEATLSGINPSYEIAIFLELAFPLGREGSQELW